MPFRIEITDLAEGELKAIRAFERRRIVDEVRGQLSDQQLFPEYRHPREEVAVSGSTTSQSRILTSAQQTLIKSRADDNDTWLDQGDLERRRRISEEVRHTIGHSRIADGETLDRKTFCRLVSLQWQIQNLNPMQMPRLLGTYHYKVHFRGFEGTRDELLTQVKSDTWESDMYEGADLEVVSEALRKVSSQAADDHYHGAKSMLDLPGAGVALVSGFLHLCHPDVYSFVNNASTAPFHKDGWLNVTQEQRRQALSTAKQRFAGIVEQNDRIFGQLFRWQAFFDEVRSICGFEDFHVLDQFVWTLGIGDRKSPEELLKPLIEQLPAEKDNIRIRAEAEAIARTLIETQLGNLSATQLSELFEMINTCGGKSGVVYTRFAPAFVGHNANQLLERANDLNIWIRKLWLTRDAELPTLLDQFWEQNFAGGGRSLPTAILYLRDKEQYAVWTANLERALYSIISGLPAKIPTGFSYLQYCDRLRRLRRLVGFPPELHDWMLFKVFTDQATKGQPPSGSFAGFTVDTFHFMAELTENNNQTWFHANRQRFQNHVDEPLRKLVEDLGSQVITSLDPGLETTAKANKCISRIRKNIYGQQETDVYQDLYWAAFYRKWRTKQTDCQFYITIRGNGLSFGVYFGEQADDVRLDLIQAMEQHPELAERVYHHINTARLAFVPEESSGPQEAAAVDSYAHFAEFVKKHHFNICRDLSPEEAQAAAADLKRRIAEDFRTLYPLFKLAVSDDPERDVPPYLPDDDPPPTEGDDVDGPTIADVADDTFMEEAFFAKLDLYLQDKQQLIFFGPPGTGKTFIALKYAEYLTQDKSKVQCVQFHPSYGYEDFMEGLRPVLRDGHLVYAVEDGIFKQFCDEARTDLNGKYVLLIDEINRGNLPRILGELLFLLERREETTTLPYSKEPFSIPRNVIILGTMNSTDRSISLMDLALRRRFHFVTMEPRQDVLLGWLKKHKKPLWIEHLFRGLNEALRSEHIDNDRLVGHAHFMSKNLSDEYLELIWEGTIEPMLKEYFYTEPERLAKFQLEKLTAGAVGAVDELADLPGEPDDAQGSDLPPSSTDEVGER